MLAGDRPDPKLFVDGVRGPWDSAPQRWIQGGKRPAENAGRRLLLAAYEAIASEALEARRLVELRDRWLNPPEWVEWVEEPVPGYPKRPVPRDEDAAKALRKRTLTNLYNARPQWLADAHDGRRRRAAGHGPPVAASRACSCPTAG